MDLGRGHEDNGAADSLLGGEEMPPAKTGNSDGEANSPRSGAVRTSSLRGDGRPAGIAGPSGAGASLSWVNHEGSCQGQGMTVILKSARRGQ